MKTTLDRFTRELEQLQMYITFIDSVGEIIKYNLVETDSEIIRRKLLNAKNILSTLPYRKVFEYNSIVVSMYGFFEKFIEDIMVAYLELLCHYVSNYNDLPCIIKENHSLFSAQLVQNLKLPKYENENLSNIIMKLHGCLINNESE